MRPPATRTVPAALALIAGAALVAAPVAGQDRGDDPGRTGLSAGTPVEDLPASPILTLDEERLFTGSRFGQRVLERLDAESAALATENRSIEAQLSEEERMLTQRRLAMDPDAFRAVADDFHTRVEAFRNAQEAKARALLRQRDEERQRFFEAAVPVLGELVRDAGAVAILSNDAIVLAFDRIDITDAAIARLDARLNGDHDPDPAPEAGPAQD